MEHMKSYGFSTGKHKLTAHDLHRIQFIKADLNKKHQGMLEAPHLLIM